MGRLFNSPSRHDLVETSRHLASPARTSLLHLDLASEQSSPLSSASSPSSSATFWMSPRPTRWSLTHCVRHRVRSSISKKQIAVVVCVLLALGFWTTPPPGTWRRNLVHVTIQQSISNPYQVLRPVSQEAPNKHTPDPMQWLETHSHDRHAEFTGTNPLLSTPLLGHKSTKPRAALISLVRNSELAGLMQSMRQLELRWNQKYNYPWIFFNDEPFSEDFKVGNHDHWSQCFIFLRCCRPLHRI